MEAIVESEVMPSESPNESHKLHDHFLTKKERSTGSPKSPCSDPSTVEQTPKTNCSCQSTVEKVSVQSNNETDTLERERSSVLCLGAIHTPKPIDTIDIKTIYMTTDQDKVEAKCLVKSVCVEKNASDISIQMPDSDTTFAHSLDKGLEKVQNELSKSSSSSSPQSTERALISQESEEKECVWDTSVSSGCNVILHNQIENGMSTCESAQRKDRSVKGSIIKDALESAKTSMSRASDSSGVSDDSNWSNANGSVNKPHKGNDPRWKAIIDARTRDGMLGMKHFRLLKQLGCGDIGTVYLAELGGTQSNFAMKVMDKVSLANRKKLTRAQTEREILQLLDHPFLPTLYTHFETERFSCLVMEFCSGGDLHTLRQRQPGKHFSEYAARFYAAEILLALEYLHMLGVVYRDLKPENVLVRSDGHIMLSDFDLSLRCTVSPTLIKSSSFSSDPSKRTSGTFCVQPACIEPASVCIQPACFLPRFFPKKNKKKSANLKTESRPRLNTLPELVVEPTSARSMSFVGTHEYLAPEIIKGEGHGSAVDWWTFGIFLHELLYGRTPFKGAGNRATLFNVIGQQLKFPDSPVTSYSSRDLIRGLLVKEPQHRLGYKRGATEIKNHPFFEGVNWALIRCSTPPDIPKVESELMTKIGPALDTGNKKMVGADVKSGGKYLDFEFF